MSFVPLSFKAIYRPDNVDSAMHLYGVVSMLDRAKIENGHAQAVEFEWHALSKIERSLIGLYRQLNEQDRKQLRRLTKALVTVPDEAEAS